VIDVRRTARGLVRVIPGLALVAVVVACGSDDDPASSLGSELDLEWETTSPSPTPESDDVAEPEEDEPVEQSAEPASVSTAESVSGRYTIQIPSIGVDAPVVSIASENRVLVPPRDPGVVGWWKEGAAPGDARGSAILVGHSVSAGGGVFDEVNTLSVGERVDVDGRSYSVESIETLAKDELPSRAEELFDQGASGRIVVVTCDDWDGQTWQSNTIVIATPA
jgi:sortase (surface protein transpeptidase)